MRVAGIASVARALALAAVAAIGCSVPKPAKEGVVATGPGDSLASLSRAWVASKSPDEARDRGHQISCEQARLLAVFGFDSANAIMKRVEDTVFSIRDLPARRRVDGWMSGAASMQCPEVDRLRDSLRAAHSSPPAAVKP